MRDTVLGISILIFVLFVIVFVAVVIGQVVDSMFTVKKDYGDYCTQIVDTSDMEVVRCEYPDGAVCYHSLGALDCLEK